MKKILMVVTSHGSLGDSGHATGLWMEEFTTPYYAFLDAGFEVTVASPAGGCVPIDPKSMQPENSSPSVCRFGEAGETVLGKTVRLADCRAADFVALFYPGGHGPMWDLAADPVNAALLEEFVAQDKPVAAVCHGPAALLAARIPDGSALVRGRKVTGFSDSEEILVGLNRIVPFLLEDRLRKLGAEYRKGGDWSEFAIADGKLVTGQNPQSAGKTAELLLKLLR